METTMKTNEHGYPTFILTTKHGDLSVTVSDKTPEKDSRGYDQQIHPIYLRGLVKINGIEVEVNGWFRVYNTQDGELHAYCQYGIKRAGSFGADATPAARNIVNGYAVKAYKEVTPDMWLQARRAILGDNARRLRNKAAELREEAEKLEKQAQEIESKIP